MGVCYQLSPVRYYRMTGYTRTRKAIFLPLPVINFPSPGSHPSSLTKVEESPPKSPHQTPPVQNVHLLTEI